MESDRSLMLVRIAEMYYERNLSQREIADTLEMSRPMVSRMLAEARSQGVVTIQIHRPIARRADLEFQLRERFGLLDAVVVPVPPRKSERGIVGAATAEYLHTRVVDANVVGLSWGRDLVEMVNAFQPLPLSGVHVVQLAGGLGEGDPTSDGPNIARAFAEKVRGTVRYVFAPTVVENRYTRDALVKQPQIAQSLRVASALDIAVTGVGALDDASSTLARAGYLSRAARTSLIRAGGVAHVLGYVIDDTGLLVDHPYNGCVVAASLEDVRRARLSIGMVAMLEKARSAQAALNGRLFDVLVTTEPLAAVLLEPSPEAAVVG